MSKKKILSLVVVHDFDLNQERYLLKVGERILYSNYSFIICVAFAYNYYFNHQVAIDIRLSRLFAALSSTIISFKNDDFMF